MQLTPLRRALLASAALLLAAPGVASAATVTRAPDGALEVVAAPGELNRLGVQPAGDDPTRITLYDGRAGVGSATPDGCTRWSPDDTSSMVCPTPTAVRVHLGDGDDEAYVSSEVTVPVAFYGEDGNDALEGNAAAQLLDGGPGNDRLRGLQGNDTLVGGDGNDDLQGGAGQDLLDAGSGDDLLSGDGYEGQFADLIDGGPGLDRIEADFGDRSYDYRQPPVTVTLGGGADDGRPGELDDVRGVERVAVNIAGSYTGTDADETLEVHQVLGAVTLDGRGGTDTLIGADGPDQIDGGPGADTIDAGFGDDVITPGPGRDVVAADRQGGDCGPLWCKYPYGNDTVYAADGEVDSISCGAGTDRVVADPTDIVATDCEQVERQGGVIPQPGNGGAQAGGADGGPGPSAVTLTPKSRSLRRALSKGLAIRLTGLTPKRRVTLTAKSGKPTVARGSARASSSGRATVVLRFSKHGRQTARGRSKLTVTVSGGGVRSRITLKR